MSLSDHVTFIACTASSCLQMYFYILYVCVSHISQAIVVDKRIDIVNPISMDGLLYYTLLVYYGLLYLWINASRSLLFSTRAIISVCSNPSKVFIDTGVVTRQSADPVLWSSVSTMRSVYTDLLKRRFNLPKTKKISRYNKRFGQ